MIKTNNTQYFRCLSKYLHKSINRLNINRLNFNINLNNLFFLYFSIYILIFCISGCSPKFSSNSKHNSNSNDKYSYNHIKNYPNVKVVWSKDLGNIYTQKQDKGPSDIRDIPNLSLLSDAIPKYEPKSRYGNPPTYKVFNKTYKVLNSSYGYKARGYASWYGTKFHGYRTSSGEIYDMYKMTAAHKTLPLPTYIKVVNVHNKRSVIVKVNDRGPFHGDRIVDLSYAAASKLGIVNNGVGKVEIIAMNPMYPNQLKSRQTIKQLQPLNNLNAVNLQMVSQNQANDKYKNLALIENNQNKLTGQYLSKSTFQLGAFAIKENATNLVSRLETLLKKDNLLKDKHYQINILEDIGSKLNKNNILYKVVIKFNKGKHNNLNYQKFKNIILNLPSNNLAINI